MLLTSNLKITIGLLVISVMVIIALLAPLITWHPPLKTLVGKPFTPPNRENLFGTDDLGRDIYAQTIYGLRTSLIVGITSSLLAVIIGILIGAIAGYYGGIIDDILMRIADLLFVIPPFFLALLIVVIVGPELTNIIIAIAITSWAGIARITRAQFLRVKEYPFVEAARALGATSYRIMFTHILPNTLYGIIPYIALQIGNNIFVEAGLGFLGLSDPNVPSLGRLLNLGQQYLTMAWWIATFPGIILAILIIGFNLLGDGLIEYFNPRIRRVG